MGGGRQAQRRKNRLASAGERIGTSRKTGGGCRNRTDVDGFAIRCIATLLTRRMGWILRGLGTCPKMNRGRLAPSPGTSGAGKESRTLDLNLGKVALYQLSYSRIGRHYSGKTVQVKSAQQTSPRQSYRGAPKRSNVAADSQWPKPGFALHCQRSCRPSRPSLEIPSAWPRLPTKINRHHCPSATPPITVKPP